MKFQVQAGTTFAWDAVEGAVFYEVQYGIILFDSFVSLDYMMLDASELDSVRPSYAFTIDVEKNKEIISAYREISFRVGPMDSDCNLKECNWSKVCTSSIE